MQCNNERVLKVTVKLSNCVNAAHHVSFQNIHFKIAGKSVNSIYIAPVSSVQSNKTERQLMANKLFET